jgi:methyl-accepting chemotaxis protein
MNLQRGLLLVLGMSTLAACNTTAQKPIVTSAADQTSYAVRYPDSLASARGRFSEQENRASRLSGDLGTFVNDIEPKNWKAVSETYRLSDSAGKSQTYAERYEETQGVSGFFTEEKDKLNQAVAGNVAYSAKQNNCKEPGEVAGTATFSLGKAVDKQLKERLRSNNEAQSYIDAHAESIGKNAVEKLRDQVDKLTELSYTVHVGVERTRQQIQGLFEESSRVKSTLNDAAKQADEMAADTTQPEADRKAAKARAEAARTSAGRIDSELQQAKFVLDNMDQRIKKLRDDYQQAQKGLLDAADQKASAPASATK